MNEHSQYPGRGSNLLIDFVRASVELGRGWVSPDIRVQFPVGNAGCSYPRAQHGHCHGAHGYGSCGGHTVHLHVLPPPRLLAGSWTEAKSSPVQGHAGGKRTREEPGLPPLCSSECLQPGAQAPSPLLAFTMVLQKPCLQPCICSSDTGALPRPEQKPTGPQFI